ncbi:hypothetical protein L1987_24167 [Smallanthus sonchifolius]|uniref:Uncharacterized protein n=1 Tax=Smallanthus sonchifolius TaxID=185202 RepID=A0ACB9IJW1_9ASTR|nr:hypothetical protein L1987_24167 [Smallanthus sonchifolius]
MRGGGLSGANSTVGFSATNRIRRSLCWGDQLVGGSCSRGRDEARGACCGCRVAGDSRVGRRRKVLYPPDHRRGPNSASTPPSQQLYRRRRRPQVQREVAITSITEVIPVIVTLPTTTAQVAVTTPILTESVTITPTITPTTLITSSIPSTTIDPLSQPFNYGDFTQGFEFDTIFSSPIHNAEASSSRHPDPNDAGIDVLETQVARLLETIQKSKEESDAQQAQINSLVDEVRILRSQRTGTDERQKNVMAQNELLIKTNEMILGHGSSLELRFETKRKEHELMVKLIVDLTKKLDAQGEK